ncbi:kelch-like protein 2 [Aphis craccivora]|uniref:Kelch-like protein 2 n=1 Tax=Aphis craccivora TaxID=307492 RepID=A0A6G0Y7N8_APHCR|nr:kelch-like protein 2 [Aphis craccivora]
MLYYKRCGFHRKMNNDNLSPSSSQNQVQKSREPFPTRYYYAFEVLVVCDVKLTTDDGTVLFSAANYLMFSQITKMS